MKLLLMSESPLEKIGEDYYAVDPWIRFPINLATQCEQMTLWAPVAVRKAGTPPSADSWRLDLGNLKIEHHDNYNSFVKYYQLWFRRVFAWIKNANRLIKEHDVVLLRLPSPMISIIAHSAKRLHKPLVVFVAGDVESQSDRIIRSRGLKRLIYKTIVKFLVYQEIRWSRNASIIYVYSKELAYRHRARKDVIKFIRTPHLTLKDFVYRNDICKNEEIRLLRVCWLIPSKGLEFLLEAVSLLIKKGLNIRLELVGKERAPSYQATLEALAEQFNIRDKITFTGWVPFDKMHEVYMRSDIQVISSLAEGTPRIIIEGAARGLPLVCTTVGGCIDNLHHEVDALLVPPGDGGTIAEAVERIIKDAALKQRLISKGYEMATAFTFEKMGMQIVQETETICQNWKNN